MNDQQLLRYSRQIMLADIDIEGQEKLLNAKVLIVGLGGLGSAVALYLAAAGVGNFLLADFDYVDLSNLQRQVAHTTARIGNAKVDSAAQAMRELNPHINITCIRQALDTESLNQHVAEVNVVIDCCDNFTTRFAVNTICVKHQVPLVSGAAIRMEGQVAVFDNRDPQSPCYSCLYDADAETDTSCVANGILAPVVGVIGSLQALEVLRLLIGFGASLIGRVQLFDARHSQWRELKLIKDPCCPVCAK